MNVSTHSTIHKRFKCFVDFIAPEPEKRSEIKKKVDDIRHCIETKAARDGYVIIKSRYSGSFAKHTGLRGQLRGNDAVPGQDIDIAFILKDKDAKGNPVGCMIHIFEGYLRETWPNNNIGHTKSSATIWFEDKSLEFDAVPLIESQRKDIQTLIRTDGTERQSSWEHQTEFMKNRTAKSNKIQGVVRFNECVRLIKWWRYQQQSTSGIFGNGENDKNVPSFLLDLLCAWAFDTLSVRATYAETLACWFGFLAHTVRNRHEVIFDDFIKPHQKREEALWKVIDPMDDTNNVVKNWRDDRLNELAEWFGKARDRMNQAIRHDEEKDDSASLDCLVKLFGNSIKNQCKDAQHENE